MAEERLTKIVATLGPASDSLKTIEDLIKAGVNVFRFNTKHGTTQWHQDRIERVQKVADKLKTNVGILIDLQGPEIRLETINKLPLTVEKGQFLRITPSFISDIDSICIPHSLIFSTVKKGNRILIDDGSVELVIERVLKDLIETRVVEGESIGHRKGVNFPGVEINLPSLIHEDLKKLDMVTTKKVDYVALSFSRTKKDIELLRHETKIRKIDAMIVAKIENLQALNNLDEIISASDAVMVARGDLGIEVPIEQIAYWQKIIINKCRVANKPVITATQMLQSMSFSPRPTRAEATDVANAVFDGTDALMLSSETASGKYPVNAVVAMDKIARYNEQVDKYISFNVLPLSETDMIINSTKELLNQNVIDIKKILVFTSSGLTARSISRLRPRIPIIALTTDQKTVEKLSVSYGIRAIKTDIHEGEFSLPNPAINKLIKTGELHKGDDIVVIHGQNFYREGSTNAVAILKI